MRFRVTKTTSRTDAALKARLPVIFFASMALAIAGCTVTSARTNEKPVVLATFTVIADMADRVGGGLVTVESITKVGAEIHGYEPTPGDLRRAAAADVILDNGLNLEAWFAEFVANLDVDHVVISDGVEVMNIAGGDVPNPHAWMSPLEATVYIDNIVMALSELDPANSDQFQLNARRFKSEIQEIHQGIVDQISQLEKNQRALVTCEGAFSYLARDLDLVEAYIWPVNAEQQATPRQVARTIEFVRDNAVPAVFCESTVSDKPMQQVIRETGSSFGGTLYVDSLSDRDGPVPTYLDLLRYDGERIATGLLGNRS